MTERQLIFFMKVYERRSIIHVAEEMYISPQAVSKTILAFEKELNMKLFERKDNSMIPTQNAEKLIYHVKIILDEYNIINNQKFASDNTAKKLRILATYDSLKKIPEKFFYDFKKENPNISLHFDEMPDDEIIHHLNKNYVELALLSSPFDKNAYESELLFESRFCYIINKNNPISQKETLTFNDLNKQQLAIKGTNHPLSKYHLSVFSEEGIDTNAIAEISDSDVIIRLAEENFAVAMTLDYIAEKINSDKVVIKYSNHFMKNVYIVNKSNTNLSDEASIFKSCIVAAFNK